MPDQSNPGRNAQQFDKKELSRLADEVYRLLLRELEIEKERQQTTARQLARNGKPWL